MSYAAKILADSISPDGVRLTTMEVTFPRIVLAEFNTHRMFSRNSASSRAIPVEKMIQRVLDDPFLPVWWGKNQSGMQATEELAGEALRLAKHHWLDARDFAVACVRLFQAPEINLHKQIANRLLEPFLWHTVIVTATEWENFFALRCHKDAQPEIRIIAEMMRGLYRSSEPRAVDYGEWHLPLVDDGERAQFYNWSDRTALQKCCVGRCARVSYLTHDGRRDPAEDVVLADRLRAAGHMSPFEHAARPMMRGEFCDGDSSRMFDGNFRGWVQYRKILPNEAVYTPAV